MKWEEQFKIIHNKISSALARTKLPATNKRASSNRAVTLATHQEIADYLGVKVGKVQAWRKGQRPSADDLEIICRRLGYTPRWLLLGEGPPEENAQELILNNAKKPIGDLLRDLIVHRLNLEPEEFASQTGVPLPELQGMLASAVAPSWETLKKLVAYGVNANFLLAFQFPDLNRGIFDRIEAATKLSDAELADLFGVYENEVTSARADEDSFPPEWIEKLVSEYGANRGWLVLGTLPSHCNIEGPAPQPTPLEREIATLEQTLRRANASDETIQRAILARVGATPPSRYPVAGEDQTEIRATDGPPAVHES